MPPGAQPNRLLPDMTEYRTDPIDDPAAWYGPELAGRDDWITRLTGAEADEVLAAVKSVQGRHWSDVTREDFLLPTLSAKLTDIAGAVDRGAGVAQLKGLPVDAIDEAGAQLMLWGLGQHVGVPQVQDAEGSLLHDVRDTGDKVETNPSLRVYQTNAEQRFHNDGGDMVMLLCRRTAKSGGASRMASAVTLFNEVLKRDPALAQVLQEPFHFDARGQQLPGRPVAQQVPIFTWHAGRMSVIQKRHYIESAQRFESVPPLTETQTRALDLLDDLCHDPAINIAFELEPGDIQIANNFTILHARDAFEDHTVPDRKRHMLRLWLGLPDGRPLPEIYRDTREFGPLFELPGRAGI